jgi:two-component sensor histidine kinase
MKYAFPDNVTGQIDLSVESADEEIFIVLSDNGCGLPADFDPTFSDGLGMRIVTALTQQIRGKLDVARLQAGTRFKITLPKSYL